MLFVHGAWHGAWCWDEGFLDRIAAAGYTCHAMSLRNHGRSDPCGSLRWISYSAYVHDVRMVMASIGDVVLVGHSMGGYIVQKVLESTPAQGAALIAPVPVSGTLRATLRFARRHPVQYLKVLLQARLWPIVSSPELAGDVLLSDPDHPDARRLAGRVQDESFRTYLDMMFFALPQPERVDAKPPMLVLGGTNDRLFSVREFKKTASSWDGTFRAMDGMPHDLMLADGWQTVADELVTWLDEAVSV